MTPDPGSVEGVPGPAWCRAWTDQVDSALRAWMPERGGLAVVALGSYARRQLCPASDVDLLLLHNGWGREDLSELVRRLCYPLWDAGLQVGHAVRTPAEAVRAAGERVDSATALTDRRLVAGDRGLLDDLGARATGWLRRNAARVLSELERADESRRAAAGRRPGMLEPHLKDGAGGLRDLAGLRWAAACLLGEVGLDALVNAHYLGAAGRRELAAAGDVLLAARCALHLVRGSARRPAGRELDRLRLDVQDEVAARLGLGDGSVLLRQVGLATRSIAYHRERTWPLLMEDTRGGRRRLRAMRRPGGGRNVTAEPLGDGLFLRGGTVAVDEARTLAAEPSLGLRAVAAAGTRGMWLARPTAERLRHQIAEAGTLPWDGASRGALLELLRAGGRGLPALADASAIGLLAAHLPEWEQVKGRPQRNPFHRYDLDTHLAQTVAELADLTRGGLGEREAALAEGLPDPDTLLLAAWLHDIGKAWPGDHSIVGAQLAARWIRGMGFAEACADRVALLIRHHLLLFDVATRRDLDDPDELAVVAAAVGDPHLLDALYLLSLADARATGPAATSPWKDELLGELHRRVRRQLTGGQGPVVPDAAAVAAAVRAASPVDVADFLDGVDARYLTTAGAEEVAVHARLARPPLPPGALRASVRPGPAAGTWTLSLAAGDRRGLVADCAGVLAAHGLEVLDARAFTARAMALDWFVVRPRGGVGDEPVWEEVIRDLAAAAAGTLDVDRAVADRERRRDARPLVLAAPVAVDVAFDTRDEVSRVEIRGPDAPGLLYRLARVLADAGVDVIGARVATFGPEVRDVFFVRDDLDAAASATLATALRAAAGS